jgi:hypothetical protein
MNKKDKKKIRQRIKEIQVNGQTNKEIYNKLVKEYDDEKTIAELIVTTVKPENRKKHYLYIGILLGFTAIILFFNIWIYRKSTNPFTYMDFSCISFRLIKDIIYYIGIYVLLYIMILTLVCKKQITSYIFLMITCSCLIFYLLLSVFADSTVWGGIH